MLLSSLSLRIYTENNLRASAGSCGMLDDIRASDKSLTDFAFSSNIEGILEHQFRRQTAKQWARNLRFLTFDDGEHSSAQDNDAKSQQAQCARCELRVPPSSGHICFAHAEKSGSRIRAHERRLKEFSDPCMHIKDTCCDDCANIPLFPNQGKVRRFRVRRLRPKGSKPSTASACTHFVAVSYCWEGHAALSTTSEHAGDDYQVLEEDMTTMRPIRAPKDTIDRAVGFAAANGIRMIWIDQVKAKPSR